MSSISSTDLIAAKFPPLIETNYNEWKYHMQARLMQNAACWMVIDGTYTKPADNLLQAGIQKEIREWNIANLNAAGLIFSNVSSTIQPFIRDALGDAKLMWKILKEWEFERTFGGFMGMDVRDNAKERVWESIKIQAGFIGEKDFESRI